MSRGQTKNHGVAMRYSNRCAWVLLVALAFSASASGQINTTYAPLNVTTTTQTALALDCVPTAVQITGNALQAGVIDPLEQFTCPPGGTLGTGANADAYYKPQGAVATFDQCVSTDPVLNSRRGLTHVVLSTGNANYHSGNPVAPEPGTQTTAATFPPPQCYDSIQLAITLQVPTNATSVAFDWRMLTAEFPETTPSSLIGKDRFRVTIETTNPGGLYSSGAVWFGSGFPVDVTTQSEFVRVEGCPSAQLSQTGFDILSTPPSSNRFSTVLPNNGTNTGTPDAGAYQEWRTAHCRVKEGDTITVRFTLEDHGDGLVDTAVYLDFLRFNGIVVADANSSLNAEATEFTRPTTPPISDCGRSVLGVGADGEARLLLTCEVPSAVAPGALVTWQIAGPQSPQWPSGSLYGILDSNSVPPGSDHHRITAGSALVDSDWWSASLLGSTARVSYAIYRAPADFATAPTTVASRTITIQALANGVVIKTLVLTIVRPPVVLSHGFTGRPSVWDGFGNAFLGSPKHFVHRANWASTSMDSYWANRNVVQREARAALDKFLRSRYVGVQVDWMGHSMGGCLPRYAEGRDLWRNDLNYMKGYVHKLILGNSPQAGSPWADEILPFAYAANVIIFFLPGVPYIPTGALESLSVASCAVNGFAASSIPTHALYGEQSGHNAIPLFNLPGNWNAMTAALGTIAMDELDISPFSPSGAVSMGLSAGLGALMKLIPFASLLVSEPALFPSFKHDLIVSAASQKAGLSASATTNMDDAQPFTFIWFGLPIAIPNPFAASHIGANKAEWMAPSSSSPARHTRLDELLDHARTSPLFALPGVTHASWGYPGTGGTATSVPVPPTPGPTPSTATATFVAINPNPGSNVASGGDTITLTAVAGDIMPAPFSTPWVPTQAIFHVGPYTTRVTSFGQFSTYMRTFTGSIALPIKAFGSMPIYAIFSDATGRSWGCTSSSDLQVGWGSLNLLGLTTRGSVPTLTKPLQKVSLEIVGAFADGTLRPMKGQESGLQFAVHETSFSNSNTPVLTMTPDGAIIPRRDGDVELVVSNNMFASGPRQINIPIKVRLESVQQYGSGLGGAAGVPLLDTGGQLPFLGNANFRIRVSNARPASTGFLLWSFAPGNYPLPNGSAILVDLAGPLYLETFTTSQATTSGTGSWVLPFPLPWAPALEGFESYLQALVADPGATGGVAITNALYIMGVTQ